MPDRASVGRTVVLTDLLSSAKVDCVLVGGLAVALHGYQRVTVDVDVAMAMDDAKPDRFIAAADAAGLRPTMPLPIGSLRQRALIEQRHRDKGTRGFSPRSPGTVAKVIDVLVRPKLPHAERRRDAGRSMSDRIGFPLCPSTA